MINLNLLQKNILKFLVLGFAAIILLLALRGTSGNPTSNDLNKPEWKTNGPFELSPERGRFALLYSVVEDKSFTFSRSIGDFANPDVAVYNGNYVSLFAPGVSFIVIPGYLIGKVLGVAQLGTFFEISLFALVNLLLIFEISKRLGANKYAAALGGLTFLFATPAFSYAINLYQHHISTFLILLSIYLLIRSKNIWSTAVVFLLCGFGVIIDYPNLFFMFPIGVFALARLVSFEKLKEKLSIKVNLLKLLAPLVVFIPILFLLWFQANSYGSPLQLSGTLKTVKQIQTEKSEVTTESKSEETGKTALGFFQTRHLMNGFYLQTISPDRGVVYYTPIILLGIVGIIAAYQRKVLYTTLLVTISGAVVLLYALWGDPWGGWAFGLRYLIPAYALLSIFIALLLTYWKRNLINLLIFLTLFVYSAGVNTLGAVTSSANPPEVEIEHLQQVTGREEKYSYDRNAQLLANGVSKSFVYNKWGKNSLEAWQYYLLVLLPIISAGAILVLLLKRDKINA